MVIPGVKIAKCDITNCVITNKTRKKGTDQLRNDTFEKYCDWEVGRSKLAKFSSNSPGSALLMRAVAVKLSTLTSKS